MYTTLKYKNNLVSLIIVITIAVLSVLLFEKPFKQFFDFESLTIFQLFISVTTGFLFEIWYKFIKWRKRVVSLK